MPPHPERGSHEFLRYGLQAGTPEGGFKGARPRPRAAGQRGVTGRPLSYGAPFLRAIDARDSSSLATRSSAAAMSARAGAPWGRPCLPGCRALSRSRL